MARSDVPSQVRIRCGEENRGRFIILDETTDRFSTDARSTAVVQACANERDLRSNVVEAVSTAVTDGPLRAEELAKILSTSRWSIDVTTDVTTEQD